jgi:ribosomal protein L7/L12
LKIELSEKEVSDLLWDRSNDILHLQDNLRVLNEDLHKAEECIRALKEAHDRVLDSNRTVPTRENGYDFGMHMVRGEKIAAIKAFRALSGCGLREAKEFVEGIFTYVAPFGGVGQL